MGVFLLEENHADIDDGDVINGPSYVFCFVKERFRVAYVVAYFDSP